MTQSDFIIAKTLFEDENKKFEIDSGEYILLESFKKVYATLLGSDKKPLKMIMLYGPPGSGKTAMLSRLASEITHNEHKNVLTYLTPTFAHKDELRKIYNRYASAPLDKTATFFDILTKFNDNFAKDSFLVLLDEAQLYSEQEMELIRLLSDTRVFKFIIALHSLDQEEQIAKAHFQTRIWDSIELKPLNKDELRVFVERKLLSKNLTHLISAFDDKHYKLAVKWTNGNVREAMKFFYKLFDFYDYLEQNYPSQVNRQKFTVKHFEMLAIHCGYITL